MTHFKENTTMGTTPSQMVKKEEQEIRIAPAVLNASTSVNSRVKTEPIDHAQGTLLTPPSRASGSGTNQDVNEDVHMPDAPPVVSAPAVDKVGFKLYDSASDIPYTPEHALQQGLQMVKTMNKIIDDLQIGSKLRKEVWLREIGILHSQASPTTLIAICGATGAGKSSILNAILDDNIVPTSGMRACTAVVTEIAYHKKKTIDADVSFLSEQEWKAELEILLTDLVDEEGHLKRTTDLKSDAGVAWQKVHAVYPTISQERLITMSVDQIIAKDPKIANILGVTKKIVAKDSRTFALEIAKYIDSKDQKRGKDKKKEKKNEKSLIDRVKDAAGKSKKKTDPNTPALWPLIRQVNVRCSAAVLSTGAVLVDLPGTGDANQARNAIAKEYMKKCDCVWVLAAITRAVDDKIAKDLLGEAFRLQLMMDGNYDDHAITFIATKCDDISCSEVIRALSLDDEPQLEAIQETIEALEDETSEWKKKKGVADRLVKSIDSELKVLRPILGEYETHLQALKDDLPFVPILTAKKSEKATTGGKKRKNIRAGWKGSAKKRRSDSFGSVADDDDDDNDNDNGNDSNSSDGEDSDASSGSHSSSESGSGNSDDEMEKDPDADKDESSDEKESDDDVAIAEESEDDITEDSVNLKISETKDAIKNARERHSDARKQKKEAIDSLATLKKKISDAQKEKNAFCSLARNEFSRDVLKEDFRSGLKDLDEAAAERRDPENFDPAVQLRDYAAIDLPVFTCSSRDYVRIKKQVKGDGEPTCFTNVRDTGIPDLQQWCHRLTVSSRERAARNFLAHLTAFATGVQQYVAGIGDVTAADRELLREKWESGELEAAPAHLNYSDDSDDEDDPFAALLGGSGGLYTMPKSVPKVDRYGNPIGIAPRLSLEFNEVVETSVASLKSHLRDGLEERCQVGAANAAESAVSTSDEFAAGMHWNSYRATLRRHGQYRRDLNEELVNPFTRSLAQKWQQVFEADIFASFSSSTFACINKLVSEVEQTAALGLKDRARLQGESCLEEARVALNKTIETVKVTLTTEQKEISRCLSPHVQEQLMDGYDEAMLEVGKGSVARQKASFHTFISGCKDEIFEEGADVIMERLATAAEAIGKVLKSAMEHLAQQVEVNLAVLWEGVRDDTEQVKARSEVVKTATQILDQLRFHTEAEKARELDADVAMG